MSSRRSLAWLLTVGAGLLAAVAAEHFLGGYVSSILQVAGLLTILAVSLNLTNGFAGVLSLAHPGFMTIGAYVAAILTLPAARKPHLLTSLPEWLSSLQVEFVVALIIAAASAAAIAALVGVILLRLRGHYVALATLAFTVIIQSLATNMEGVTRGALGINGLPPLTTLPIVFACAALVVTIVLRIKHLSIGRALFALRENEMAASCIGIAVPMLKLAAFVLGALFAGLAGALWAHLTTLITPSSFPLSFGFLLVAIIVLGGLGSVGGALLAAIAVALSSEIIRRLEEATGLFGLTQIMVGIAVIAVLQKRPQGIFGLGEPATLRWFVQRGVER